MRLFGWLLRPRDCPSLDTDTLAARVLSYRRGLIMYDYTAPRRSQRIVEKTPRRQVKLLRKRGWI